MDRSIIEEMGSLGLLGVELPEEYGGLGLDCVTMGVIMEEMAYADPNIGYIIVMVSLNGQVLLRFGDPDLVTPLAADICTGRTILAGALTEPSGGSDLANMTFRAHRENDKYVLSGEKTSITMSTQADATLIWARTGKPQRVQGG